MDERRAPLRQITKRHTVGGVLVEELECGHFNNHPRWYGYANPQGDELAKARRCPFCATTDKGETEMTSSGS